MIRRGALRIRERYSVAMDDARKDYVGVVGLPDAVTLQVIGWVRSPFTERYGTPRQPRQNPPINDPLKVPSVEATVELNPELVRPENRQGPRSVRPHLAADLVPPQRSAAQSPGPPSTWGTAARSSRHPSPPPTQSAGVVRGRADRSRGAHPACAGGRPARPHPGARRKALHL